MFRFIKENIFIAIIFLITLAVGFLTFLTFINKSFIQLNDSNLQYLLIANIILLIVFFYIIFREIKNSLKNDMNIRGSVANRKYITFFSLFTLIPSVLISIFSLFLFSFALEKYFDNKITTAVNNSYELAKNYVDDKRNKVESDIVMVAFDLNKNYKLFNQDDKNSFKRDSYSVLFALKQPKNKFQIDDKLISSQELFSYFFNQEHNSSIIKDDSNRFIFLDNEKVYTKINKF